VESIAEQSDLGVIINTIPHRNNLPDASLQRIRSETQKDQIGRKKTYPWGTGRGINLTRSRLRQRRSTNRSESRGQPVRAEPSMEGPSTRTRSSGGLRRSWVSLDRAGNGTLITIRTSDGGGTLSRWSPIRR